MAGGADGTQKKRGPARESSQKGKFNDLILKRNLIGIARGISIERGCWWNFNRVIKEALARLDGLVENLRMSLGAKLGVSRHRVKLLHEHGEVLNASETLRSRGLVDGALGYASISAPDEDTNEVILSEGLS